MAMPATAASSVSDFDGVYEVAYQYSTTSTHSDSSIPQTSPLKSAFNATMTVKNGLLLQSGVQIGAISNPNGSGQLRIPLATPFLGDCVGPLQFTRDSSGISRFTGQCKRVDTIASTLVGPTTYTEDRLLTGTGANDSIRFAIPAKLGIVKRGYTYSRIYSFCQPQPRPGYLCGGDPTSKVTNIVGGPANLAGGTTIIYSFTTRGFLPRDLVLNFRTGMLAGTLAPNVRPRIYKFEVCAYTSIENRYSACQPTQLTVR